MVVVNVLKLSSCRGLLPSNSLKCLVEIYNLILFKDVRNALILKYSYWVEKASKLVLTLGVTVKLIVALMNQRGMFRPLSDKVSEKITTVFSWCTLKKYSITTVFSDYLTSWCFQCLSLQQEPLGCNMTVKFHLVELLQKAQEDRGLFSISE